MRRTLTIAALAAGLMLTACGSDGDSGSDLSESQAAAAQSAIDGAAEDGLTLDESCVNDIAAQLSDEDAELAAGEDDAELSPEGEALTVSLLTCADEDALVDVFIQGLSESGPSTGRGLRPRGARELRRGRGPHCRRRRQRPATGLHRGADTLLRRVSAAATSAP